jgi:hypothetical protein
MQFHTCELQSGLARKPYWSWPNTEVGSDQSCDRPHHDRAQEGADHAR